MLLQRVPILRAALAILLIAAPAPAQMASEGSTPVLADRILAVVDEEPILASDVARLRALGLAEPAAGEDERAFELRILQELIDQRLRFQEIDRYGFTELPIERVEEQYAALAAAAGGPEAWQRRLVELDLEPGEVKALIARQLLVLTYIEERLGPRVFVALEDIELYYEQTLGPAMRDQGAVVPPIEEVREQIREVLRQQRLNEELAEWTGQLRREADIADYSGVERQGLPPVVDRRGPAR